MPGISAVVGTSTVSTATPYSFKRRGFFAKGRLWVFWSDGTNMVYSTSVDGGRTWTAKTTVRPCTTGYYFSIWFDGKYMHYAYADGGNICYRRGTPNSDGTITWSADEQTLSETGRIPFVSVDTDGYAWIGYLRVVDSNGYPYVIKSGNNDGTWGTTPAGFPYQLSPNSNLYWCVSIIPLTSGKMLAIYTYIEVLTATIRARSWDGSAWRPEVATTSAIRSSDQHSAVAEGDDVHLAFLSYSRAILHTKYIYATNSFTTETTLQAEATRTSAPVISRDPNTGNLYVFWAGYPSSDHIYYRKGTSEAWEDTVEWMDESAEVLTDNDRLICFYNVYDFKAVLIYMTKTDSPFNVKYNYLPALHPQQVTGMMHSGL